jgi:hypothetical protein
MNLFKIALIFLIPLSGISGTFAPINKYKHVVLIGVDGLGSHNLYRKTEKKIKAPRVPNINFMKKNGAWTLDAKIDRRNWSGPNWMGILSGFPSDEHGIHSNDCLQANESHPTIFKLLRDDFPKAEMGVFYNWKSIGCYQEQNVVNRSKRLLVTGRVANSAIRYLKKKKPKFLFIYLGSVDHAGHSAGGSSRLYKYTLEKTDKYIGKILKALRDTGMMDDTLVVLTADHGHHPTSKKHSSKNHPVPFMVLGKGIQKGEIKEKMKNNMVAPLVRHALTGRPSIGFNLDFPDFYFLFN